MARNNAIALKLVVANGRGRSPLTERLNNQVLDTIRELAKGVEEDPGVEDEYEFEIFGNTGPTDPKKNKK